MVSISTFEVQATVEQHTICWLLGKVEMARRKVRGAVLAINRAHWKDSAGLAVDSKFAMIGTVEVGCWYNGRENNVVRNSV